MRAARPAARLWAIFEPRSASSCRRVFQDAFADAFAAADRVIIAPVFRSALPDDERLSEPRLVADLAARGVRLALGATVHDPTDPMGRMFFNILATFAEFEADLIRLRTREGMAIARARGRLRGKVPKLSDKRARELRRMHDTGTYSISDLAELFAVSRATVYRTLQRVPAPDGPLAGLI